MTEVRDLPDGTREWREADGVWVREGTYDTKREALDAVAECKAQGYGAYEYRIPKSFRDDPYWKDAKWWAVYQTKEAKEVKRLKGMGGKASGYEEGSSCFECKSCSARIFAVAEPVICPKCGADPFVTRHEGNPGAGGSVFDIITCLVFGESNPCGEEK